MTSSAPTWAIVDGHRVPYEGASVHVSDLGLRRGLAVFEFFRVISGVPLFIEDHLERLQHSAATVGLPLPRDVDAIAGDVHALISANAPDVSAAQILVTGGPSLDGVTFQHPTCIVTTMRLPERSSELSAGSLISHRHTRELPEAKSTNYLTFMRLAASMKAAGATDILYHDGAHVLEGARSGLAFVLANTFVTRREGVLQSVTMRHLVEVARARMRVELRPITVDELHRVDEVLDTGAVRGVVPITTIDARPVGNGAIGPHARALAADFAAYVNDYVRVRKGGVQEAAS